MMKRNPATVCNYNTKQYHKCISINATYQPTFKVGQCPGYKSNNTTQSIQCKCQNPKLHLACPENAIEVYDY